MLNGTAQLAAFKVLVKSVCVLGYEQLALAVVAAVGAVTWVAAFAVFGALRPLDNCQALISNRPLQRLI
jgi:hypothetical protein